MSLVQEYWSNDRSLSVLLGSLLLLIFVVQPLGDIGIGGRLVMSLFFSLVLISGVGAIAKSGATTKVVGAVVVSTFTIRWLRLWFGGGSFMVSDALFSCLFCTILAIVVLAQVFREGPITWQRIQGAVAVYLLFGLAWAFAYEIIDLHSPSAFAYPAAGTISAAHERASHFIYFSFITLTTTGYGDITAVHPFARSLVTFEVLTGQLFPSILLARLVSMEVLHRQTPIPEPR